MSITRVSIQQTVESILHLFEEHVSQTPDVVAVICSDGQLTYYELDRRANQLAWYLRKLSVGPETLVGICVERSLDMVVGILGILKAGGAYVPLDPSYPRERLSFILEDAKMAVLVTERKFSAAFLDTQVQIVYLDSDKDEIAAAAADAPMRDVLPENLAYVIYTSGSTGRPKGVMITHSNLSHFVRISGMALDVMSTDVVLQTASIAYALSVRQLMVPLAKGATVVIATAMEMQDPLLMFQLVKYKNITLMDLVPSFWSACVQRLSDLSPQELEHLLDNSLRRIVSIGEPLYSDLPQTWLARFGRKARLVNIFGQTETTGVVAAYPIPLEPSLRVGIVPIGRSIPDTALYILDSNLNPVSPGEQGELCVSNPCIGRGYLNHPELTSKKFIPNPFDDNFCALLYRTGDMARMREDGNIEFLGRGDQQVKIRGQRLELGEVEALLRQHPSVHACVVTVRGDQPEEKFLAAYIEPAAGHGLEISELRAFMRRVAPAYMVPSVFLVMDSLPLTPNGKIDRLSLPDPFSEISKELPTKVYPADTNKGKEQILADIWKELLNIDYLDLDDNFFDLGGHSLTAVRLFSRIEKAFGVRLPVTTILQAPTIAALAGYIDPGSSGADDQVLVPICPAGDLPPFYCVHGVGGAILGYRDLVNALGEKRPFYGLQAVGSDEQGGWDSSIEQMASRYVESIRSFQPRGPYQIGGYCFGGVVAYEMACQLERQGEQVSLLGIIEGYLPDSKNCRAPIPQRLGAILGSIPHWIKDYAGMSPEELRSRMRNTYLKIKSKIWRRPELLSRARIEEILQTDLTWVPERNVELTKVHSAALRRYRPSRYGGKVTLFRAKYRSINEVVFGSLDCTMGWGDLALGGVEVRIVDGYHRNVHLLPYVSSLASELNYCLAINNESE